MESNWFRAFVRISLFEAQRVKASQIEKIVNQLSFKKARNVCGIG